MRLQPRRYVRRQARAQRRVGDLRGEVLRARGARRACARRGCKKASGEELAAHEERGALEPLEQRQAAHQALLARA